MDFLILAVVVMLLSLVLSSGLLIAFINFGVFPRPEADDFARKLYWRNDTWAEYPPQTATIESVIAALAESPEFTPGTDAAVFWGRNIRQTSFDVFPDITDATAAGERVLVRAA